MIQRIQSVYLLLAAGVSTAGMCLSFQDYRSLWGMWGIMLLCAVLAMVTIFRFQKRVLQIRMSIFNCILLLGYYPVWGVFEYLLKDESPEPFRFSWALCCPAIAVILSYLAIRAIGRDEVMVKASDRLRS